MTNIELLTVQLRLEGVRQAISRARFTFVVSVVASVAIFVTTWNAYVSQDREFALQTHWSHDRQFTPPMQQKRLEEDTSDLRSPALAGATQVTDYAQQQLVSEWVKNQVISVGLLGIRVSVGDLPELGSLTIFIMAVWLFYSVNREKRAIGTLLDHAGKFDSWDERYMVYEGIVNHLIFIDFKQDNRSYSDLAGQAEEDIRQPTTVSRLVKLLFILPPLSVLFAIVMDVLTLRYFDAPFRPSHLPLWNILEWSDLLQVAALDGVAIILLVVTTWLWARIIRYTEEMGQRLNMFRLRLLRDWEQMNNPPEPRKASAILTLIC